MTAPDDLACPGGSAPSGKPLLLVACAVLVDADGRVLLTDRPPASDMAGLWEFPGGKVEALETPEAALVRELREELGIETAESCLAPCGFSSHGRADFHLLLVAFAIRKWRGTPRPLEGQKLLWARPPEIFTLPLVDADRPLLGQISAFV